ncbi:uncharacterized protein [Apostichopus japonicus]|uniref:uncharacterized protein isoform X2 n=1 Tax=Stichopus japonicus TaxID=307972 RepID=UPI003AB7F9B5
MKDDLERGLFQRVMTYKDIHGEIKKRKVLKDDRMWFHPPECPDMVRSTLPSADAFFRSRLNFCRPVGVWGYSLKCPRNNCPARDREDAFLYHCGYANTVRYICDISDWYCMLTEVLACSACRKAAKASATHSIGQFLAWDALLISQLTPAHQAMFPAILTLRRGVDKQVVRLMTDRTAANSMASIWRQVQENHCEKYLHRKDIYSTLLTSLTKEGSLLNMQEACRCWLRNGRMVYKCRQ